MAELYETGALCPLRVRDGRLETLLQRRAYWNLLRQRPMLFPGEWIFAGGRAGDESLLAAAIRECREELGYDGRIARQGYLREGNFSIAGREYRTEFWAAKLTDEEFRFRLSAGEVTAAEWMTPETAIELITSERFAEELKATIAFMKLDDPKYGQFAVKQRQFPWQTVRTLAYLARRERELMEWYAA